MNQKYAKQFLFFSKKCYFAQQNVYHEAEAASILKNKLMVNRVWPESD